MSNSQIPRILPIQVTDTLMFDDEFSSMKERFAAEMRRIDDAMNKFSANVMQLVGQSTTVQAGSPVDNPTSTLEALTNSPLVEGEGDNRTLKLQFDVSQFDPEEVTVKIVENTLMVTASHEKKTDNTTTMRQYYREFQLPHGVDPNSVVTSLSKDGVLLVEAPFTSLTFVKPAIE